MKPLINLALMAAMSANWQPTEGQKENARRINKENKEKRLSRGTDKKKKKKRKMAAKSRKRNRR